MEELQKTQEYAAERERERRQAQQPYEGEDRRKKPDSPEPPVSTEDGTGRR